MNFTRLLSLLCLLLLAFPLSAQELTVPDFSKGMPDVNLERKEKIDGQETFHLKTALNSKEFSITLSKFLGAGWGKRKLNREEMILAANKGRTSNAEVNLAVYAKAKVPGVDIRVIHLKDKEENAGSSVEIVVIREADEAPVPKADRTFDITYRDEHYNVPEDEIWKLTWKSPYQAGEISPAYDVRVLGRCFTTRERGTQIGAHNFKSGGYGMVNIHATNTGAEIWIPSGTEFYLANDRIKVNIEVYKNDRTQ